MSKKEKNINKNEGKKEITTKNKTNAYLTIENIIFALLVLTLFISPYFRGLLFRENYYVVQLLCTVLLIGLLVSKIIKKSNFFSNRKVDLLMWGLPIAYFISYFFAADPGLAKDELLRNVNYAVVYYILAMTMTKSFHRNILINVFIAIATWTSLFGYGVALGDWQFKDAVLSGRISSAFQYPNTLAAVLGAAIFMCLVLALKSYQKVNDQEKLDLKKSVITSSLYLTIASLLFAVFILTYSRGAWLIFALTYIVALIFLPLKEKIPFIFNTVISLTPALYPIMKHQQAVAQSSWLYLLAGMFLTAVIALAYNYQYCCLKFQHKKLAYFQVGVVLAMAILVASATPMVAKTITTNQSMVQTLVQRVETFKAVDKNTSASARLVFYHDATKMYKDHPIIGKGGGAWRATFEKYQSYAYFSNQAHIYYLQLATETGTVGVVILLLVVVAFFTSAIMLYINRKKDNEWHSIFAVLVAFIMLMGHNFLDFDMSFSSYGLLIVCLIAIVFTEVKDMFTEREKEGLTEPNIFNKIGALLNKPGVNGHLSRYVLLVLSAFLLIANAQPIAAYSHYQKAQEAESNKQSTIALVELAKAYEAEPSNTKMTVEYINAIQLVLPYIKDPNIRSQQGMKALNILEKLQDNVPENVKVKQKLADFYAQSGQTDKAMQVTEQVIEVAPYDIDCYKQKIVLGYHMAELVAGQKKDVAKAKEYLSKVLDTYNKAVALEKELAIKGKNQSSTRPFIIDAETKLYAGKAYYLAGNYATAKNLFSIAYANAKMQQEANLWLAATYKKLNDAKNYQVCANRSKMTSKDFTVQLNKIIAMPKL